MSIHYRESATGDTPAHADEPERTPELIETMRVEPGGRMPLLDGHLERLQRSCLALGHRWPGEAAVRESVMRELEQLDPARAWRLRLLLASDGTLTFERGLLPQAAGPMRVILAAAPRIEGAAGWLQHKTTHRPWYADAAAWLARHPDIFDVLYWNADGDMCEGSRSNLYMQTADGRWLTPPLEAGALPGVQRNALLRDGLVEEAPISREAFLAAPAWRISNALRGWCDVELAPDDTAGLD